MQFNFDQMKDLYKNDPVEFDKVATLLINEEIDAIADGEEERIKLLQYQFRIESVLRKYKDPIVRMNVISQMMLDHLDKLRKALTELSVATKNIPTDLPQNVVPLTRPHEIE